MQPAAVAAASQIWEASGRGAVRRGMGRLRGDRDATGSEMRQGRGSSGSVVPAARWYLRFLASVDRPVPDATSPVSCRVPLPVRLCRAPSHHPSSFGCGPSAQVKPKKSFALIIAPKSTTPRLLPHQSASCLHLTSLLLQDLPLHLTAIRPLVKSRGGRHISCLAYSANP
ncbi:hypothetical protein ACP4OV_020577 [Aristida adscensionis]